MRIGLFLLPEYANNMPYLGMAYISTILKDAGHEVKIFDWNIKAYNKLKDMQYFWTYEKYDDWMIYDNFKEKIYPGLHKILYEFLNDINIYEFDVFGFSIFETNWRLSYDLIEQIKKMHPGLKIIVGGPLVSLPEFFNDIIDSIKSNLINAAVIGEGENKILKIINCMEKNKPFHNIPGVISINKKGEIYYTVEKEDINLNELPTPDFEGFDLYSYNYSNKKKIELPFILSRGCVAQCEFCVDRTYYRKYRYRLSDKVINDLKKHIEKYNINTFVSLDLLLNGNFTEFDKLVDSILKEKLVIYWGGNTRVDKRLTQDFLLKLSSAGCKFLIFGLESCSENVIKLMKKNISLQIAEENFKNAYKAHIDVIVNLIVSYPGETYKDFIDTVIFIKKNMKYISFLQVGVYTQTYKSFLTELNSKEDLIDFYKSKKEYKKLDPIQDNVTLQVKKFKILNKINKELKKRYYIKVKFYTYYYKLKSFFKI